MTNISGHAYESGSMISDPVYYLVAAVLTLAVLYGIYLLSKVAKARLGNRICAAAVAGGVVLTLLRHDILPVWGVYPCLLAGVVIGYVLALRVKMIEMPQMVALLNGSGGAASAIVGGYALMGIGADAGLFSRVASTLALEIGTLTLMGSLIAAGKLHRLLPQKPIRFSRHRVVIGLALLVCLVVLMVSLSTSVNPMVLLCVAAVAAFVFGVVFTLNIGGADMPITISLLNSLSGVAGAISGLAIGDVLLVSIGSIVGASGLLLTQIMCRAMNRSMVAVILGHSATLGKSPVSGKKGVEPAPVETVPAVAEAVVESETVVEAGPVADPYAILAAVRDVIIVPGYGMAIAHAQHQVKTLADRLQANGARVRYAIHPVAGRMPGHMNVLLAEADVDYDDLCELDDINPAFKTADLAIVVGANDVMNPAARQAEGTPIYGMPILNVDECKHVFIFNFDLKPGYAGVENPLYQRQQGVTLFLGNAAETLTALLGDLKLSK